MNKSEPTKKETPKERYGINVYLTKESLFDLIQDWDTLACEFWGNEEEIDQLQNCSAYFNMVRLIKNAAHLINAFEEVIKKYKWIQE